MVWQSQKCCKVGVLLALAWMGLWFLNICWFGEILAPQKKDFSGGITLMVMVAKGRARRDGNPFLCQQND